MIGIGGCIALTAGFTFVVKQKKAAEVFEGYEPNDPVVTQLAMEMRRGRSLPPGNPFWSERMRAEVLLQQARPRDLPLPIR